MAGSSTVVDLTLAGHVEGQQDIAALTKTIEALQAQIIDLQNQATTGGKDWLDYSQQISGVAESMTGVVSNAEEIVIKTAEISAAIAIYQKWRALVTGVQTAYTELQNAIALAGTAISSGAGSTWNAVSVQTAKLETQISSLAARFASLETLAKGLSFAGLALTVAELATAAHDSNEQTRQLTEQIGGLSTSLQQLDPASRPVQTAKERFQELYKASLALHEDAPALVEQYKQFFDTTEQGNLTIQQSGRLLTDFNQVQKSLQATTAETDAAQTQLNDAFETGLTTIPKLGVIFGAALNPALDAVAKSMGLTRQQLSDLIDTGQVGAETVLPALAAAARNVTAPLSSASDAAEFAKTQFQELGYSTFDLANKSLPGVAVALQYTAKEIANTADASVDPIGAAVERIENFGARIAEWARLTKQSITDAFASPDIKQALDTGLKEAMYGLDFLLVGLKEEFVAVGESIGVVAGAAVTATNPLDDLKAVWSGMADRVLNTRDRLNEYINALEGVDNASGRTAEGAKQLEAALKTIPEIKLPEKLQDIIDKLDGTQSASSAVSVVWKELAGLDFSGNNIRNLFVLRQTIQDVTDSTKDATGTQAAFSEELSKLPVTQIAGLLAKVTELSPRLKQAGDDGALLNVALGAAFEKLGLNAAEAAGKITQSGKDAAATFALIANSADTTGTQIRAALDKALDSAKTQADVAAIQAEFTKLAQSGQASSQLIADGQGAILRRIAEMQGTLPALSAAFKDLGIASAQHLRAIADASAASFKQLQQGGATINELRQAFLSWAAAEIQAANAAGLPVPAIIKQQAASMGLTDALAELMRRYHELQPEQEAHAAITNRVARASSDYVSALQAVATAQLSGVQAEIDLANAKGNTVTVAIKTAELARLEAQWAKTLAEAKQAEIAAEKASVEAKIAKLQATNDNADATLKEIAALQLQLVALGKQAEAEAIAAKAKELAATRAEALAGSLETLLRQYQDLATEHARDADTSERYYQTQLNEIDGAIRVAKAKGDEADAEKLLREQTELRIAQAEAEAQARAQAAADAQQAVDLKTLELAADGELSKADQQQIADLQSVADAKKAAAQQSADNAQAMREEADAAEASSAAEVKGLDLFTDAKRRNAQMTRIQAAEEKARAAETKAQGDLVTSILSGWEKRLGTLSDASRQAFDNWQFGANRATESVNALDAALKKNEADMRTAFTAYKDYGFVKWSGAVALHALQIERAFLNQKQSADSLVESLNRLGAEGGPSFDGLIRQAETAKTEMTLLDQASLNNLQNEIDAARQRMQALQEETIAAKDRISELNAEIAREKGDTAAADALDLQLEKQQKLAEVENNLAQARLENNRELIALYESQRSKLQELYDLKSRNLEKEQQQTKTETTSTTTTSSSGGTTSSAAPSKTYQLNLVGDSGQTLTATTSTDPTAFLDALTAAKKRSLA